MKSLRTTSLVLILGTAGWAFPQGAEPMRSEPPAGQFEAPPFVKKWTPNGDREVRTLMAFGIEAPRELENEAAILREEFPYAAEKEEKNRIPVRLALSKFDLPGVPSRYHDRIAEQAYRIRIRPDAIVIESPTPSGVAHGIQTLSQMVFGDYPLALWDAEGHPQRAARGGSSFPCLPCGEVMDWPDLPVRMIMVDPARQNENFDYYKRLIRFCARYKINAILLHLTDDDTAALYHPDYPELMHPHAWKPEEARELVALAARCHIELIPEIESLGHSRMFVRRPDFREILHQTRGERTETWMGTDIPGYTNVLCPASEKTYEYLDKMYARAAECFPGDTIHIGCDEVDMTSCERCEKKFPGISTSEWFRAHLLRCREMAARHGRKIALWGDMLLKYPDILDGLPTSGTLIYDWHYLPDVSPESVALFQKRGYEVIACPALMCSPHMLYPDEHTWINIRAFTEIARRSDLLGVNTTIWIPQRYLSDVLWPGIAFAADQAWNGSNQQAMDRLCSFFQDFFGASRPLVCAYTWYGLTRVSWHRTEFLTACWCDEASLEAARKLLEQKGEAVEGDRHKLEHIIEPMRELGPTIRRHREAWTTMVRSARILDYALEHLQAARDVHTAEGWNRGLVRKLDKGCVEALRWIEEDWDRNRYADDPNQDGLHKPGEHLLHRFRQMHAFHQKILEKERIPDEHK